MCTSLEITLGVGTLTITNFTRMARVKHTAKTFPNRRTGFEAWFDNVTSEDRMIQRIDCSSELDVVRRIVWECWNTAPEDILNVVMYFFEGDAVCICCRVTVVGVTVGSFCCECDDYTCARCLWYYDWNVSGTFPARCFSCEQRHWTAIPRQNRICFNCDGKMEDGLRGFCCFKESLICQRCQWSNCIFECKRGHIANGRCLICFAKAGGRCPWCEFDEPERKKRRLDICGGTPDKFDI